MRRFVTFSKGLRILLMMSMVLALGVSMVGTALAQVPVLVVNPKEVPATQTFIATVTGFKAKEAVVVLLVAALAGEDIILTGGECDDKGVFASAAKRIAEVAEMATIPAGVKPGKYSVKATGTAGSTATAELTVTAEPTPTPKPTPKPVAATPAAKPADKPAATPAPVAVAKPAVPKTGTPIPMTLIGMAGIGLGAIGFALRRRF